MKDKKLNQLAVRIREMERQIVEQLQIAQEDDLQMNFQKSNFRGQVIENNLSVLSAETRTKTADHWP
ncbi:hypothetical protein [Larkinella soli]|uniref:hypothetical protein n=1 Tax=Larkinella soli TaxID=1770527 RepID=UPI000FFB0824|nr:hypothetical protein [Larkinella soli]